MKATRALASIRASTLVSTFWKVWVAYTYAMYYIDGFDRKTGLLLLDYHKYVEVGPIWHTLENSVALDRLSSG